MVQGIFVFKRKKRAYLKGVQADICIQNDLVPKEDRSIEKGFNPDKEMKNTEENAAEACVGILSRLSLFLGNVLSPLLMASPTRLWLFVIASVCFLAFILFALISKNWWVVFPIRIPPIFAPLAHYGGWIALTLAPIFLFCFIKSLIPLRTLIPRSYGEVIDELNRSKFCFSIEPLFCVGDFKDLASLAVKLRDAQAPLSQYIREQFSKETQQLLDEYDGSIPPSEALVDELNRLLQGDCLYDEQRFEHVKLTKDTQKLIKHPPQGEDLIRLNRWLLEEAYPHEIENSRNLGDSAGGGFSGASAGGSFFCASASGVLKKWDIPERNYLIPPWGRALLKEEGKYTVSTKIDANRNFTKVGGWDKKLEAVLDARLGGREIEVVMCSLEDWRIVQKEWENLTKSELADKKDWLSGCRYAQDLGITFLACPNVNAFLRYLMRHRLRWIVPRLLAVIGLVFVLLSGTYPPKPVLDVKRSPNKELYHIQLNTPPIIEMYPGEELALFIEVIEPLSQYPFICRVEASSESLWTDVVDPTQKEEVKKVVIALIKSKDVSEVEKVNFKMPSGTRQARQEVEVTIRIYDHYGQYGEEKYLFRSK